jgi:hypothetical protein
MKGRFLDVSARILSRDAVVGMVLLIACAKGPTGPNVTLADFYLTTQISGWVADSGSHFVDYSPTDLFSQVDGAAQPFQDGGLVQWCTEKMNGGTGASPANGQYNFSGSVYDFGTVTKAKSFYESKIAVDMVQTSDTFSDTVPLGQYTVDEAEASRFQGGITVDANFEKYYIKFSLSGFADPLTAAPEALKFLDKYKAIAQ